MTSSAERFIQRRRAEILAETERPNDGGCDHREFYPVLHVDGVTVLAHACYDCAYTIQAMEG